MSFTGRDLGLALSEDVGDAASMRYTADDTADTKSLAPAKPKLDFSRKVLPYRSGKAPVWHQEDEDEGEFLAGSRQASAPAMSEHFLSGLDAVPDGAVSWHGIPPCRPATAEPTTAAARRRRAPLAPPYATAPADEVENVPPKTAASPSDVLRLAAAAGSRIRLDDEHPSMMPWASSWMDQSKRPSSRRVRALPRGSQIPWG